MMKTLIVMGAMALSVLGANAQDFKAPLAKTWVAFDTLPMMGAGDARQQQANKLVLIAKKWDKEWITHFYVALSKTMMSYEEKDVTKHDAVLDDAEKELQDAVSLLGKNNDETYVLAAMIANSRLGVDPMNRWQKYGKIFTDDLQAAKEINPNNPRMYYLKAVSTFFTPAAFGGGKKNALPYFEKADGLFAAEKGDDVTKPYWGKRANTYFYAECKKDDKEEKKN
jgi:hypothetical protein